MRSVEDHQMDRDFEAFFTEKVNHRANEYLQAVALIAAFLFPLFGGLDWILFPDNFLVLIVIRICILPVILGVFFFTFRRNASHYVEWSGSLLYQGMALAIDLMVYFTGGEASRYYSGVELVLLAMFLYMPGKPKISILNGLIIYFVYIAVLLVRHSPELIEWHLVISNSYFMLSTIFLGSIWAVMGHKLLYRETLANRYLREEKIRSENLLLNILPRTIARELGEAQKVRPVLHPQISVLFTDFVDFTRISSGMTPENLLFELDRCFMEYDRVIHKHGLEKLKTIGDAYMCAAGIPEPKKTHAVDCVMAALDILEAHKRIALLKERSHEAYWGIRIGIHSGPVVAGVTGTRKFAYDIWGDTVNTASRTETAAQPDSIAITATTHQLVEEFFECRSEGPVSMKGKGMMEIYQVIGYKNEFYDSETRLPTPDFFRQYRRMLVYGSE